MVSKCRYCGGQLVLNEEWVCRECGTVARPVYAWPRRRITKKEVYIAILRGYA
jgi:transcription initiation factor TFIIIB Brf1 subunit/transcription initiation factor TFIIB